MIDLHQSGGLALLVYRLKPLLWSNNPLLTKRCVSADKPGGTT